MSDKIDAWLIWSNEHDAWWKPDSRGYTKLARDAGRYCFDDALEICIGSCDDNDWTENRSSQTPNEVMVPSPEMLAERSKSK
jgi:hypothetical protein